jgi:hypothetical protein
MSERGPAQNKTSATPSQATQASSPLLRRPLTSEISESVGSNSNISQELGGIQPKTIRRRLNWENITVEAPSRGNGMSLPGGIQRQQEEKEETPEIQAQLAADSAQKSALESSNSPISTSEPAQKPLIARAPFNGRNIPVEAPARSSASSTYPGGIQRLETSEVKEQEKSTESLQMQPEEAIQARSSEGEPQEKEEQNKELVQTKLTVGAPGDKYEQEADSMAAKVMTMPDSAIQQPIQRQTGEDTEAVQMQPLLNSITSLVQRSSNPTGTTPGHTLGRGSFRLAPGGIQAHEGHKILTSSGKEKEIHLIAKHGPNVLEADMEDRLEKMKQLFEDMRNDKIAKQQARIAAAQLKINEFNTSQQPTNPQKITERQARILGLNGTIAEATSLITEYRSINKNDRNAVFEALDKWKPKSMPTYRTTKFSNLQRMKRVITVALGRKQTEIDAAFIDSSGHSKTSGTSKIISHTLTGMNLGIGYELDSNMKVVPISTPLQTVVLSLVISSPFEYMVETAYLEA